MSWRILHISKSASISIKDSQLVYSSEDNKLSVPIEDIAIVILENHYVTLTSYLLSQLASNNILLITCDASHMPNGIMYSYLQHSRALEVVNSQINTTEPLKKRLWQSVIKQKVLNQAKVLSILDKGKVNHLEELSKNVLSGDTGNIEAVAASAYWTELFGKFNRKNDLDIRNGYLNYGYAVLRGVVARSIVGAGLLPLLGIHHSNNLNQFNLADDIMEPFRPFVDLCVYNMPIEDGLTPTLKKQLVSIMTENCKLSGEFVAISKASEQVSYSLAKSIKQANHKYLKLPELAV